MPAKIINFATYWHLNQIALNTYRVRFVNLNPAQKDIVRHNLDKYLTTLNKGLS